MVADSHRTDSAGQRLVPAESDPPVPRSNGTTTRPTPYRRERTPVVESRPAAGAGHRGRRPRRVEHPRRRVLAVIGSIIAPTTLLTALLFFFGMLHAHWFFAYFGVNYTVLGLTTQDFLIRSADGLFVPMTVLAAVVLCGLWGYRSLNRVLPEEVWERLRRAAGPAVAIIGSVLVLVAVAAVLRPVAFAATLGLPGLCLTVGVLLLSAVSLLLRARRSGGEDRPVASAVAVGEWAACFVLGGVGLFWAAGDYSSAVGTGRGDAVVAGCRPPQT